MGDIDVLCTFKIKIESQSLDHWYIKDRDHIQIKIKMPNPSQKPPASSKAPNEDLTDMDVLCTFKIKLERQNSEYGGTKDQWPYPNQYWDAKPQSGTSSILQSPKSGLEGHGCSLHLQSQYREPKFGIWVYQRPYPNQYQDANPQSGTSSVLQRPRSGLQGHGCSLHLQSQDRESKFGISVYQRPVTISKSISGCQTPVRNLQYPPKPQIRTQRTWMFFAPSKSRYRAKIRNMGVPKTSDHIKIKIKMPNPSQEPPASSKAPNEDLKDMDVLCTFKIKIKSQNSDHGCIKDQ